jgi:hypothetical protein
MMVGIVCFRLDQARVEFDHSGHMDVSDQASGLIKTARCEKIGAADGKALTVSLRSRYQAPVAATPPAPFVLAV